VALRASPCVGRDEERPRNCGVQLRIRPLTQAASRVVAAHGHTNDFPRALGVWRGQRVERPGRIEQSALLREYLAHTWPVVGHGEVKNDVVRAEKGVNLVRPISPEIDPRDCDGMRVVQPYGSGTPTAGFSLSG
jgi:hypothetical protein